MVLLHVKSGGFGRVMISRTAASAQRARACVRNNERNQQAAFGTSFPDPDLFFVVSAPPFRHIVSLAVSLRPPGCRQFIDRGRLNSTSPKPCLTPPSHRSISKP